MFEDIDRLPRSISDSRAWTPDWRNRQAMAYLAAFQERFPLRGGERARERLERALAQGLRLPTWEDDRMVKARFHHAAYGQMPNSPWSAAFDWCHGLMEMDPSLQRSTALKGWLLAGLSDDDIIRRWPITPEVINIFHDVWFDVRGSLQQPEALRQALGYAGLATGAAEWQRHERTVFRVALYEGAGSVDRLMIPNDRLCASDSERQPSNRRRLQAGLPQNRPMGDVTRISDRVDDATSETRRNTCASLGIPSWMGSTNDRNIALSKQIDKKVDAACKRLGIQCARPLRKKSSKAKKELGY